MRARGVESAGGRGEPPGRVGNDAGAARGLGAEGARLARGGETRTRWAAWARVRALLRTCWEAGEGRPCGPLPVAGHFQAIFGCRDSDLTGIAQKGVLGAGRPGASQRRSESGSARPSLWDSRCHCCVLVRPHCWPPGPGRRAQIIALNRNCTLTAAVTWTDLQFW